MKRGFRYVHPSSSFVRVLSSIIVLVAATNGYLWSQTGGSSVTQSVTIEVKPITKIDISGNPNSLLITDAVPGSDLAPVTDENTKYSITTNLDNMKIVASISDNMPEGTTLKLKLSSTKATSVGYVDLSNALTSVDVVTGITRASDSNQLISYTFAADVSVGEVPTQTRTITLTLTD